MPNAETPVQPPMSSSISKAERGFMHRITAFLLCPARYVADLNEDYFGHVFWEHSTIYYTAADLLSGLSRSSPMVASPLSPMISPISFSVRTTRTTLKTVSYAGLLLFV